MDRATSLLSPSPTGGAALRRRTRGLGALGSVLLGALLVTAGQAARSADAYWTDSGTITGGTVTTWALTDVSCPDPTWGSNHVLTWRAPSGTSATVSLATAPGSPAVDDFAYWTTSLQPGAPLTTSGTRATWGIGTINLLESTDFSGTWTLVVTATGGTWTATRTGTWTIFYDIISLSGTATCTVSSAS